MQAQLAGVVEMLRETFRSELLAVYLYGSAVHEGLRPHSDLDVLVVTARPSSYGEKAELVRRLLDISEPKGPGRPVDLTIVVRSEVNPWRYPPRMDFQYGDWWRSDYERGSVTPYAETNADLASIITMARLASQPLSGDAATELLDAVTPADYYAAIAAGVPQLLNEVDTDTRNVLLTLTRIWCTRSTGEVRSKAAAASWAMDRLSAKHRDVIAVAQLAYLGEMDDTAGYPDARATAEWLRTQIEGTAPAVIDGELPTLFRG